MRERINLRISNPRRQELLEEICEIAGMEGKQLDPCGSDTVWWGLKRVAWAYKLLKEQQKKQEVFSEMLGSLKR